MSWQRHMSIATLAFVVAGVVTQETLNLTAVLVFFGCIAIFEVGSRVVMRKWLAGVKREAETFENALVSLSKVDARDLAFAALRKQYRCVVNTAQDGPHPPEWPEDVRALFENYSCIELTKSSAELSREQTALATDQPEESWQIGFAFDGARVVVRARDGHVFELDEGETPESTNDEGYPSVYHWIATKVDVVPGLEGYTPMSGREA